MHIEELQKRVIDFRNERDWAQYHNPKDLAISLSLEASELLEIFQWKNSAEVAALKDNTESLQRIKEEIGDILIYALTLSHEFNFNSAEVILDKIVLNAKKYPVEKAKGRADKYTAY